MRAWIDEDIRNEIRTQSRPIFTFQEGTTLQARTPFVTLARLLARPSLRFSSRAAPTAGVSFILMRHGQFPDFPCARIFPSLCKHESTRSTSPLSFDLGNSSRVPLTPYAAGGFVASTGADYVIERGTLQGLGATAGVVGTRLVWRRRCPVENNQECVQTTESTKYYTLLMGVNDPAPFQDNGKELVGQTSRLAYKATGGA